MPITTTKVREVFAMRKKTTKKFREQNLYERTHKIRTLPRQAITFKQRLLKVTSRQADKEEEEEAFYQPILLEYYQY